MSKDRFNYVATNLDSNPAAHYVTPGGKGEKIAPAVVSQASLGVGTLVVILGAIAATLYVRKEWGVGSMKVRDAIAMHVHIPHYSHARQCSWTRCCGAVLDLPSASHRSWAIS